MAAGVPLTFNSKIDLVAPAAIANAGSSANSKNGNIHFMASLPMVARKLVPTRASIHQAGRE